MNQTTNQCTCTEHGYSPDCPLVFMQGGKLLHELTSESRLKPREYLPPTVESTSSNSDASRKDDQGDALCIPDRRIALASDMVPREVFMPEPLSVMKPVKRSYTVPTMINSDMLTEENRGIMRKHEPLIVGGRSITEMSIGGFEIDMAAAAEKARELLPLPPARLPKIYIDSDLNFHHHFFQGLERLIGRDVLLYIVGQDYYHSHDELVVLPLIEEILRTGYEKKDSQITIFTKSVLTSTFSLPEVNSSMDDYRGLVVSANFWGFQYIESGQEVKEADLRMWISISYTHFRNMHFNTFKDSGMPAFALEGVQTRYEGKQQSLSRLVSNEQGKFEVLPADDRYESNRTYRYDSSKSLRTATSKSTGRRRTREDKPERSLGDRLFR